MHFIPLTSLEEITQLLAKCGLPFADIQTSVPSFSGIRENGTLVAAVGLELYPPSGLLRSLCVRPAFRHRGYARKLVAFAETEAVTRGIEKLYLLTEAAADFFTELGYAITPRETAPSAIRATSQFTSLRPLPRHSWPNPSPEAPVHHKS